jgi:hypothetical protein
MLNISHERRDRYRGYIQHYAIDRGDRQMSGDLNINTDFSSVEIIIEQSGQPLGCLKKSADEGRFRSLAAGMPLLGGCMVAGAPSNVVDDETTVDIPPTELLLLPRELPRVDAGEWETNGERETINDNGAKGATQAFRVLSTEQKTVYDLGQAVVVFPNPEEARNARDQAIDDLDAGLEVSTANANFGDAATIVESNSESTETRIYVVENNVTIVLAERGKRDKELIKQSASRALEKLRVLQISGI